MPKNFEFTSESVTEGHPDKVCDQISDGILDELIQQDPDSRVAVETLVTTGSVHVAGEVTTKGFADVQKIARAVLKDIGYTNPEFGIDYEDAGVWVAIHSQSPDISQGVTESKKEKKEQGAGDQGMMFGYACNETKELMPLPIMMAHRLTQKLAEARKKGVISDLGPDGKSQVTVQYVDGKPKRISAVVIAQQHLAKKPEDVLKQEILEKVIKPVCGQYIDKDTKFHINATGRFVIGGPEGDTGVTGRKIIVDTYGGMGRHGGGAFSGKDPSKVDRSAAYACRYIAKNIVAAGLADRCEVELSYAHFPLKPREIIETLKLKRPIFRKTAAYGHFGREDSDFIWEKTDKALLLKKDAGLK